MDISVYQTIVRTSNSGEAPSRSMCYCLMVSCVFCNGSRFQPQSDPSTMSFFPKLRKGKTNPGPVGIMETLTDASMPHDLALFVAFNALDIFVHTLTSSVAINDRGSPLSSPNPAVEISNSASREFRLARSLYIILAIVMRDLFESPA